MLKIITNISFLLCTFSFINNLMGCHKVIKYNAQETSFNTPSTNHRIEIVKSATLTSSSLTFDSYRTFFNANRVDTCSTNNHLFFNLETYKQIQDSKAKKKDIYIYAKEKNGLRQWFQIKHQGIILCSRPKK